MSELIDYVQSHVERGACRCGQCIDGVLDPERHQPTGHTADAHFFKVAARGGPNAETLRTLIAAHRGSFGECDPFDGKEHNYLELGAWVGDQGLALMLMGLGAVLGLWTLLTPRSTLGADCPDDLAAALAGMGMVAIRATPLNAGAETHG